MSAGTRWTSTPGRVLLGAAFIVAGVVILGGAFLLGDSHALGGLVVREITPDQAAQAMQKDEFYSDYRDATLVVSGDVASVGERGQGLALTFQTHGAYGALCQLSPGRSVPAVGDTVTVVSEGYLADRLPSAVLLTGCVVVADG